MFMFLSDVAHIQQHEWSQLLYIQGKHVDHAFNNGFIPEPQGYHPPHEVMQTEKKEAKAGEESRATSEARGSPLQTSTAKSLSHQLQLSPPDGQD